MEHGGTRHDGGSQPRATGGRQPDRGSLEDEPQVPFEHWVHEHYRLVYGYALRLSGQVAKAEDLTQATFLKAWESREQVREPSRVQGWLMAICRNTFLHELRRREGKAVTPGGNHDVEGAADLATVTPEHRLDLQDALERLPDEGRVVLLMFYFEGLTYREIADTLGVKLGTVMSRLSRAKQRLRDVWELGDEVSPSSPGPTGKGALLRSEAPWQDFGLPSAPRLDGEQDDTRGKDGAGQDGDRGAS